MIRKLPTWAFYPILVCGLFGAFFVGALQAGLWNRLKSEMQTQADVAAIVKYAPPSKAIRDLSKIGI